MRVEIFYLESSQLSEPVCPGIFGPRDVLEVTAGELGCQFLCFFEVASHEGILGFWLSSNLSDDQLRVTEDSEFWDFQLCG